MIWVLILLAIVLMIFSAKIFNKDFNKDFEGAIETLPYKKKDYLFSKAEKTFYDILKIAVEDKYVIFAKVRLADLVYIPNSNDRLKYWNKIQSKHVDFILCEKDSIKPMVAIELDDASHNEKKRIERDNFIDNVFQTVNLKIIHIKASTTYDANELNGKIFKDITD